VLATGTAQHIRAGRTQARRPEGRRADRRNDLPPCSPAAYGLEVTSCCVQKS